MRSKDAHGFLAGVRRRMRVVVLLYAGIVLQRDHDVSRRRTGLGHGIDNAFIVAAIRYDAGNGDIDLDQ